MEDLKRRAIRGGFAKLVGQVANFVIRLGFVVVMARLLEPAEFGLVAMVTAVTGMYDLLTTAGLSSATVQKDAITDAQLSTLFWVNILVGCLLALLCLATAPLLVNFYGEPRLLWITIAMATGFVFSAAGVQHYAVMQRELRYVAITVIEITSSLVAIAIAIIMAIKGFGYWSLVVSSVVSPAIMTALVWLATGWIPGLPHRKSGVKSMLSFGATVTLNGLVVYLAYNLDKILVGRYWGASALGIYGRAYQLVNIPIANLNSAVGGVAFSALSRLQNDPARFKSYFLKGYSLVVSLTMPTAVFFALQAEDIVSVVLGQKWLDAAGIFRLLAPTVCIFGIINPLGWLLVASGLQTRSLLIAFAIAPLAIGAYLIGLPYGPSGVALAYSIAMTLWLVPHVLWCLHGTVVSPSDFFKASYPPAIASLVAAGAVFGTSVVLGSLDGSLWRLLGTSAVMAVVYVWMLLFVMGQKHFYFDLLKGLMGPTRSV
jgi:O-antigen/teichoic acid export membrane protein